MSTRATDREKRCINRGWNRRAEKVSKNFAKRRYLTRRVAKLRARVHVNERHISRLDNCLVGDASALPLRDDVGSPDVVVADKSAQPPDGGECTTRTVSDAQKVRPYLQAMTSRGVLELEPDRGLQELGYLEQAVSVAAQGSAATDDADVKKNEQRCGRVP